MVVHKTARGAEAITDRTIALSVMARRLLILIDGKRNETELQRLMGRHELAPLLAELRGCGCVAEGSLATAAGHAEPEPNPWLESTLPERSAKELDMGRHFIINTLSTFTGPYAHADLMSSALKAPDQRSLRALVPQWRAAIEVTTAGGRRLAELEGQLLKVI